MAAPPWSGATLSGWWFRLPPVVFHDHPLPGPLLVSGPSCPISLLAARPASHGLAMRCRGWMDAGCHRLGWSRPPQAPKHGPTGGPASMHVNLDQRWRGRYRPAVDVSSLIDTCTATHRHRKLAPNHTRRTQAGRVHATLDAAPPNGHSLLICQFWSLVALLDSSTCKACGRGNILVVPGFGLAIINNNATSFAFVT